MRFELTNDMQVRITNYVQNHLCIRKTPQKEIYDKIQRLVELFITKANDTISQCPPDSLKGRVCTVKIDRLLLIPDIKNFLAPFLSEVLQSVVEFVPSPDKSDPEFTLSLEAAESSKCYQASWIFNPENPFLKDNSLGFHLYQPNLQEELDKLWKGALDKKGTNVEFLVEGEPIYAHYSNLQANCPLLVKGIEEGYKEAQTLEIKIEEATHFHFQLFLEFIYRKKLDDKHGKNCETMSALLTIADRYIYGPLTHWCIDRTVDLYETHKDNSSYQSLLAKILQTGHISLLLEKAEELKCQKVIDIVHAALKVKRPPSL